MRTVHSLIVALAVFLGSVGPAWAGTLPDSSPYVPSSLGVNDVFQLVFVTNSTTQGNFGGLTQGDAFVQAAADATGAIGGPNITWTAILSDSSTDAIDRFSVTAADGVFNTNGDLVATDQTDFWDGFLTNAIEFGENQTALHSFALTGTNNNGTGTGSNANNWTSNISSSIATQGRPNSTSGNWANTGTVGANSFRPLYGISDPITIVPEPSSLLLAGLALTALVLRRRRRGGGLYASN